ncbi:MAG: DEAD/DEAH box helicase [Bacteroidota bacterium]
MNGFEQLGLKEELVKAVTSLGFTTPTPIQQQAIPMLLENASDLVGLAQTGTGKTAAFGLPLLNKVDFSQKDTQALIVCPTRELCLQITKDLKNYAKNFRSVNIVAIYGGASIQEQARQIRNGAQVVVATPGRLIDMIDRRFVKINNVSIVVLDEADEMLNMGFKEDIDNILENVPEERNTWLFSATMPKEVAAISRNYMKNPREITVGKQNQGAENIEHRYFMIKEKDRYFALKRVIDFYPEIFGIIFCRTRRETQDIAEKLIKDGYNCEALHGDLSQSQRDHVMRKFREKTIQLLCATDVAARGIDVNDITHVINYNLPDDIENYTHRSGRTARAGKSGLSLIFVNNRESNRIRDIERQIKQQFVRARIPNGHEICEKQLFAMIEKMAKVKVNEKEIEPFLPKINEAMADLSKEEIIKRVVSAEFNHFLNYYKNSEDLNTDGHVKRDNDRGGEQGRSYDGEYSRLFINMGEMDDLNKGMLVRIVCDNTNISGKDIGRIDIKREFSFFEVKKGLEQQIMDALNQLSNDKGRQVRVELSEGGRKGGGGYGGGGYGGGGKKPYNKDFKKKNYGGKEKFSGNKGGDKFKGKNDNHKNQARGFKPKAAFWEN